MHKFSRPAKLQTTLTKCLLGSAIRVKERAFSPSNGDVSTHEEDLLSPSIEDSKENFTFSNFGQIIKQTPFQTFSSQPSTPDTIHSGRNELSPVRLGNAFDYLGPLSAGLANNHFDASDRSFVSDLDSSNVSNFPLPAPKSILKKGSKSRYSQSDSSLQIRKQPTPQFIEVVYNDD